MLSVIPHILFISMYHYIYFTLKSNEKQIDRNKLFLDKTWEAEIVIKMSIATNGFISILLIKNPFTYPI